MDDRLAERVMDEVLRRLEPDGGPAALLVGDRPPDALGHRLTVRAPYDAVIVGSLSASELLAPPEGRILEALLRGKPVFLWEGGLAHRAHGATANRVLWGRLQAAERQWKQLGVKFYGGGQNHRLITADEARRLQRQGSPPPPGALLTPLARDILGGNRS